MRNLMTRPTSLRLEGANEAAIPSARVAEVAEGTIEVALLPPVREEWWRWRRGFY